MRSPGGFDGEAKKLPQLTHRTIAAVTEALETFAFNLAVARIYELTGALAGATPEAALLWPGARQRTSSPGWWRR